MAFKEINCPSCGAPLQLDFRFSKTVVCEYCDQTSHLENDSLVAKGEKTKLSDYGSVLYTGAVGTLNKRKFRALGRIRYEYPDGFWDEWFLRFDEDDDFYWLQEDEGEYILFTEKQVDENLPSYDRTQVGVTYPFLGEKIFVSEKNKGWIAGGEGQLPHAIVPGEQADFIDGIVVGKAQPVSFEIIPQGTLFYVGEVISFSDIVVNKKEVLDVY